MKRRLHAALFALVIVLAVLSSGVSAEDGYDAVVLATGTDEANCERSDLPGVFVTQDVCRVQEAVSANPGGKILLKGTFHFAEYGDDGYVVPGTDGTVFITNDVEISGEKDGDRFLTRILGGYFTFSVGYQPVEWSYDVDPDENYSPGDNISPAQAIVRDISFENSLYTAIRVWSTTGTIVEGNRFLGGRSYEGGAYCTGPQCSGYAYAISVMQPDALQRLRPQVYTGDLYIIDNVIDCDYGRADADDPWGKPAYGIPVRGYSYGVLIYEHRVALATA